MKERRKNGTYLARLEDDKIWSLLYQNEIFVCVNTGLNCTEGPEEDTNVYLKAQTNKYTHKQTLMDSCEPSHTHKLSLTKI